MAKTYFVTGGAGNIACQLTFPLVQAGERVVLFDIAEKPAIAVADGCQYVQGDITDREQIGNAIGRYAPTTVLHLASLLSGSTEEDRELGWRVNVDGAFGLLQESLRQGVQTVVFPSSLAAYGAPLPVPVPEDHPQWPHSLYGVTKVAIERLGNYYHQQHGLDFRCLRVPIVISAQARSGAVSGYVSRAYIAACQNKPFVFQVRKQSSPALIYIKDVVNAIVGLATAEESRLSRRVYNVQALSPTAEQILAAIQARRPESELRFQTDPTVAGLIDSWPVSFDDPSARRDWNWQPEYGLETMSDDFCQQLAGPGPAG